MEDQLCPAGRGLPQISAFFSCYAFLIVKYDQKAFSKILYVILLVSKIVNPLSANPTKWSNALSQFVGCY